MQHKATLCWLALPLVMSSQALLAAEWVGGQQLGRYCEAYLEDTESEEGRLCLSFMQGYLTGAEAVWEVASNYEQPRIEREEEPDDAGYRERAARTRFGSYLDRFTIDAPAPRFCLSDDADPRSVIRRITDHLHDQDESLDMSAGQAVHRALVYHYPCDQSRGPQ